MNSKVVTGVWVVAAGWGLVGGVQAQTAPGIGEVLQEQRDPPALPREGQELRIERPVTATVAPGGPVVRVEAITLVGNSVFDDATLLAALGDYADRTYDLAGLQALAQAITDVYQRQGYPFARAFLPAQTASDGRLRVEVIEGRYGQVGVRADEEVLVRGGTRQLARLRPGEVIDNAALERTVLLLDDVPGVRSEALMRPGEQLGTGDLSIALSMAQRYAFEIGADNFGNRYTGYNRARFNAQANGVFGFGDQLSLRTLYSDGDLLLGGVTYSAPIGGDGLRVSAGHAYTSYTLGRDFSGQGFEGRAHVSTLSASYPLLRSWQQNLTLSAGLEYRDLEDQRPDRRDGKTSSTLPLSLVADRRDGLGGGGVTYGALAVTPGSLSLDAAQRADDVLGTDGSFTRVTLDALRLQALPVEGLSLYARYSGQWASGNLDASEGLSLAGPNGVRAYPVGEVSGDEGWLAQLELRYQVGAVLPYAFYDHGRVRANASAVAGVDNPSTALGGLGVGVRYQQGGLSLDASAAWRSTGGAPADVNESDGEPRLWLNAGFRF